MFTIEAKRRTFFLVLSPRRIQLRSYLIQIFRTVFHSSTFSLNQSFFFYTKSYCGFSRDLSALSLQPESFVAMPLLIRGSPLYEGIRRDGLDVILLMSNCSSCVIWMARPDRGATARIRSTQWSKPNCSRAKVRSESPSFHWETSRLAGLNETLRERTLRLVGSWRRRWRHHIDCPAHAVPRALFLSSVALSSLYRSVGPLTGICKKRKFFCRSVLPFLFFYWGPKLSSSSLKSVFETSKLEWKN